MDYFPADRRRNRGASSSREKEPVLPINRWGFLQLSAERSCCWLCALRGSTVTDAENEESSTPSRSCVHSECAYKGGKEMANAETLWDMRKPANVSF